MTKQTDKHLTKDAVEQGEVAENLSRRGFLNTAGIAAMGGLAVAAGGRLLTDGEAKAATAPAAAPPLPWKYTKLDPLEAGKRGYKSYLANGG